MITFEFMGCVVGFCIFAVIVNEIQDNEEKLANKFTEWLNKA